MQHLLLEHVHGGRRMEKKILHSQDIHIESWTKDLRHSFSLCMNNCKQEDKGLTSWLSKYTRKFREVKEHIRQQRTGISYAIFHLRLLLKLEKQRHSFLSGIKSKSFVFFIIELFFFVLIVHLISKCCHFKQGLFLKRWLRSEIQDYI